MDKESPRIEREKGAESDGAVATLVGTDPVHESRSKNDSPAEQVSRLRSEIDATRDELGNYITELDRRRHDALDVKVQLQRHKGIVIAVGVGLVAVTAGLVTLSLRSRRRQASLGTRFHHALEHYVPGVTAIKAPSVSLRGRFSRMMVRNAVPLGIGIARSFFKLGRAMPK